MAHLAKTPIYMATSTIAITEASDQSGKVAINKRAPAAPTAEAIALSTTSALKFQ